MLIINLYSARVSNIKVGYLSLASKSFACYLIRIQTILFSHHNHLLANYQLSNYVKPQRIQESNTN